MLQATDTHDHRETVEAVMVARSARLSPQYASPQSVWAASHQRSRFRPLHSMQQVMRRNTSLAPNPFRTTDNTPFRHIQSWIEISRNQLLQARIVSGNRTKTRPLFTFVDLSFIHSQQQLEVLWPAP